MRTSPPRCPPTITTQLELGRSAATSVHRLSSLTSAFNCGSPIRTQASPWSWPVMAAASELRAPPQRPPPKPARNRKRSPQPLLRWLHRNPAKRPAAAAAAASRRTSARYTSRHAFTATSHRRPAPVRRGSSDRWRRSLTIVTSSTWRIRCPSIGRPAAVRNSSSSSNSWPIRRYVVGVDLFACECVAIFRAQCTRSI